jgi:metal-responsive CopG/Arc/MetJ family transcriptional regulator
MKTIQITMEEKLLAKLDAHEETRRVGRSAVLRRAVAEYLERHQRRCIESAYRRAYGDKAAGRGKEFEGWEDEATWPKE